MTARLDALYINFLSGWELDLETAKLIRQHFRGPIYCDLHMLVWAVQPGGLRTLRPLPNVAEWCACFDLLQMNEDEMAMMAPDPMALAATALANGVRTLVVTLGKRGAVYFAPPDFERIDDLRRPRPLGAALRAAAHGARSRHRPCSSTTMAIRPDAATCGAQPISLDCSPVIT